MYFDNIGSAIMMIYDELKKDKKSKKLIDKIDKATTDDQIKAGLREGVERLRELGKTAIAEDIESKTKGFAF
jgi:ribosomal protein L7Ae-like RNA K-turn-binding protein